MLTELYRESKSDWVMIVDSDEFLFTRPYNFGIRNLINETNMSDVIVAKLYQVYRHWTDRDINPNQPALFQRRHGDSNTSMGTNREYNKPCIVRGGKSVDFHVGTHYLNAYGRFTVGGNNVYGAHWVNADPSFCVERRLRAKERQSKRNLDMEMSVQHHFVTRESIIEECEKHLDDPEVI